MARFVALLRAINVGGHTVTMAALKAHFEAMGHSKVETFLASGNVLFSSDAQNLPALTKELEAHLHKALGFEVRTFLRTPSELLAIAQRPPVEASRIASATTFCVAFLERPLAAPAQEALLRIQSELDEFLVDGREIYWLSENKQSESVISNALLEKTLGVRMTLRGFNTVLRLSKKLALESP